MSRTEPYLILGIGELLWDLLPGDTLKSGNAQPFGSLGGAPANFSVMAARLGNHAAILSRIGRDDPGRAAIARLGPTSADTNFLQIDTAHETGRVTVTIDGGQPSYTIHEPAAWDFLELTDQWVQLAERADAICFGTLAQRSTESRQTIQTLVAQTSASCLRIFDGNLRAPYYSGEVIQESLELATVFKLNDAEVPRVLALLGLPACDPGERGALLSAAKRLLDEFPMLQMMAVTCGSQGSLLLTREGSHDHPGYPVKVADTIGAGDAFTAGMTHYLLRGADLATMNDAGNRWGAWMASQSGAMPALPDSMRVEIAAAIGD